MWKLRCWPLAFISYEAFLENKKEIWNQSRCLIFCMIFEGTYFFRYILLIDHISLADRVYFSRYLAIHLLQFFVIQFVTSQIDLSFVIKLFSCITKTFRTKNKYQERKELLIWNKTHYSWFLKGLCWSKYNQLFCKVRVRL